MDNTDEKSLLRSFFLKKEKRPHFHNMGIYFRCRLWPTDFYRCSFRDQRPRVAWSLIFLYLQWLHHQRRRRPVGSMPRSVGVRLSLSLESTVRHEHGSSRTCFSPRKISKSLTLTGLASNSHKNYMLRTRSWKQNGQINRGTEMSSLSKLKQL